MNTEADIRALLQTYETSLNTSDARLAAACYTDDGVFMPTTLPTASGAGMKDAYESIFGSSSSMWCSRSTSSSSPATTWPTP